jgi:hypothetical protein
VSKTARETGEIVSLLRELREKMGIVEELSQTTKCSANTSTCAAGQSSNCAGFAHWSNCTQDISPRERKIGAEHLHLVALVEFEIEVDSGGDTAH